MTETTVREIGPPFSTYAEASAEELARIGDLGPGALPVRRWYLHRAAAPVTPPPWEPSAVLVTADAIPVEWYRFLYDSVGEDWLWDDRRRIPLDALAEILARPDVSVTTLMRDGVPQGFFELNRAGMDGTGAAADIAYFGLMPWAVGAGMGWRLLAEAVRAGGGETAPMTVNTCTLDHPKALKLYQRAGFEIVREISLEEGDPRWTTGYPSDVAAHIPKAKPIE